MSTISGRSPAGNSDREPEGRGIGPQRPDAVFLGGSIFEDAQPAERFFHGQSVRLGDNVSQPPRRTA